MISNANSSGEVCLEFSWKPSSEKKENDKIDAKYNMKIIFTHMKANLERDVESFGK